MEWIVWFADGRKLNSLEHTWPSGEKGVLVVRVWDGPFGEVVSWGEAFYGEPSTWAVEGRVEDEKFANILEVAKTTTRPSEQ